MIAKVRIGCIVISLSIMAVLGVSLRQADAARAFGNPAAGRQLAQAWCSSCHVVDSTSGQGTSSGAPTFAAIARMKSTTVLSLRVFLMTPHAGMPDLHLSRDEIDNLAAYVLSLRRRHA